MITVALPSAAKIALQAKKDRAEIDRAAAIASGNGPVAAWAAREKADADRMATWHADSLT